MDVWYGRRELLFDGERALRLDGTQESCEFRPTMKVRPKASAPSLRSMQRGNLHVAIRATLDARREVTKGSVPREEHGRYVQLFAAGRDR